MPDSEDASAATRLTPFHCVRGGEGNKAQSGCGGNSMATGQVGNDVGNGIMRGVTCGRRRHGSMTRESESFRSMSAHGSIGGLLLLVDRKRPFN